MIRKIVRQIARHLGPVRPFRDAPRDSSDFDHAVPASQREMVKRLALIPYWEDKIKHFDQYEYFQAEGIWRGKGDAHHSGEGGLKFIEVSDGELFNVNYGCGPHLIEGWLNIDNYESTDANYHRLNLLDKHPFRENSVRFGFFRRFSGTPESSRIHLLSLRGLSNARSRRGAAFEFSRVGGSPRQALLAAHGKAGAGGGVRGLFLLGSSALLFEGRVELGGPPYRIQANRFRRLRCLSICRTVQPRYALSSNRPEYLCGVGEMTDPQAERS